MPSINLKKLKEVEKVLIAYLSNRSNEDLIQILKSLETSEINEDPKLLQSAIFKLIDENKLEHTADNKLLVTSK